MAGYSIHIMLGIKYVDRSEAWFPSTDAMWCSFLSDGLGDRLVILGVA